MARIDFYILSQQGPRERHSFACRLAEKAYRLDNTVHIHAGSRELAEQLDDLLWTFRDGSFVPHDLLSPTAVDRQSPVTIGFDNGPAQPSDLLINLADDVPPFAGSFPRVAELVTSDEDCKRQSRRRFVAYRDDGHTLETHNL